MESDATFVVPGVRREDLRPLEDALDGMKVPVKALANSHRSGALVRGVSLDLPGTTPFPSQVFALEGFNVALGCYSFPRGATGSGHSTESALCRCLERKRAEITEALTKDPDIKAEMGSAFAGGISIFRVDQNRWGIAVKSHCDARTFKLLREIGGTPLQDCSSAIQENQRQCVVGNQAVASKIADIIGATLSEESMTLENTVMGSRLLIGASTVVFGSGSNIYVPMLVGTTQLSLSPEQVRGEPFCMAWQGTIGALNLPNEDECMFLDLSPPGAYSVLPCQHITMQSSVESNVLYAPTAFPKLGYDGHSAQFLNDSKADPYHSLAAVRAIVSRVSQVDLMHENVHTDLAEATASLAHAKCCPSTVPSSRTLHEASALFRAKQK